MWLLTLHNMSVTRFGFVVQVVTSLGMFIHSTHCFHLLSQFFIRVLQEDPFFLPITYINGIYPSGNDINTEYLNTGPLPTAEKWTPQT